MAKDIDAELKKLREKRAALEKKESELIERANAQVIAKILSLMREAGLTTEMIERAQKQDHVVRQPVARRAKKVTATRQKAGGRQYRNPDNQDETWAGRGRPPAWIAKLKQAGTLEAALVQASN